MDPFNLETLFNSLITLQIMAEITVIVDTILVLIICQFVFIWII